MSHKNSDPHIDARLEYQLLITSYSAATNSIWVGYGAFFTLNGLLATGLWFSFSDNSSGMPENLLSIARLFFAFTGIAMAIVAFSVSLKISKFHQQIVSRGLKLERELKLRMFSLVDQPYPKFPLGTLIGSFLFLSFWAAVLIWGDI